jgi:2-keto-4-pentenoate hydratase
MVCGAVDVLDSRYEDYRFTLPDVIADNASAGRFLLGPNQLAPSAIDDIRLLGCVLRLNGGVAATAAGAAVMGPPAASVAWLRISWASAAKSSRPDGSSSREA